MIFATCRTFPEPPGIRRNIVWDVMIHLTKSQSREIGVYNCSLSLWNFAGVPAAGAEASVKLSSDTFILPMSRLRAWWRNQMETFSALLALCEGNSWVTGGFPSQRPVTQSLLFSLICARINGWANNRDAGYWRRQCAHYDVNERGEILLKRPSAVQH